MKNVLNIIICSVFSIINSYNQVTKSSFSLLIFKKPGLGMITLDKLDNRICIIGCSNSGKSTLANALANKLNISVYHLDQYLYRKF